MHDCSTGPASAAASSPSTGASLPSSRTCVTVAPAEKTGKPLGAVTRIQRISGLGSGDYPAGD